jgi:hypothetical protein
LQPQVLCFPEQLDVVDRLSLPFFSEDRTLLFQGKHGGASMHKLQYRIIAETDVLLSKLFFHYQFAGRRGRTIYSGTA